LNVDEQRSVIKATVHQLAQSADLLIEQAQTQTDVRIQLRALAEKLVSETALNQMDIDAAEKFENLGREAGQLKPFFDLLVSAIRAMRRR